MALLAGGKAVPDESEFRILVIWLVVKSRVSCKMDIETKVKTICKVPAVKSVTEQKAATFAASEIERLKSMRAVYDTLTATQKTFAERKQLLDEQETSLKTKIDKAVDDHQLRLDKVAQLHRRQDELRKTYREVCEDLRQRLRAAEAERIQREEIWNLFERAASLVKTVGTTEGDEESEMLKTLVLNNETRIVALQRKLEKIRQTSQ